MKYWLVDGTNLMVDDDKLKNTGWLMEPTRWLMMLNCEILVGSINQPDK